MNRISHVWNRFSFETFYLGRRIEMMHVRKWKVFAPLFFLVGFTYLGLGITRDLNFLVILGFVMLAEALGLCWRGVRRLQQLKEGKS